MLRVPIAMKWIVLIDPELGHDTRPRSNSTYSDAAPTNSITRKQPERFYSLLDKTTIPMRDGIEPFHSILTGSIVLTSPRGDPSRARLSVHTIFFYKTAAPLWGMPWGVLRHVCFHKAKEKHCVRCVVGVDTV